MNLRCIILLFGVFVLLSCSKRTYYLKSIENASDKELYVKVYRPIYAIDPDEVIIRPGDHYIFHERKERGMEGAENGCSNDIDSIIIIVKDDIGVPYRIYSNWKNENRWERSSVELKNSAEHSCMLVIDDGDVPPFL